MHMRKKNLRLVIAKKTTLGVINFVSENAGYQRKT